MADETPRTPEPCTTWSRRKRHLSTNLHPCSSGEGRIGTTLCNAEAFDEEERNGWLGRFSDKRVVVADLDPCKPCGRAAAKLEADHG